ncbi:substrate-binding domain-containing protein [Calidifontibacter terrae]
MSEPEPNPTSRPSQNKKVAAGAGLLALLIGSTAGVSALVKSSDTTASCPNPPKVQVAVAAEMYPVVFRQVQNLEQNPAVCADYIVSSRSGQSVNDLVKTGGSELPDVWIPDSSIWVNDATAKLGTGWVNNSGSVASSPIVIGVPQSQTARAGFSRTPTWAQFLSAADLPVSVQDVSSSASALEAMGVANRSTTAHDARTTLLQAIIRLSRASVSTQTIAQKATEGASSARAYPLSEQQLMAFNKDNPDKQLQVLVPTEGVPELDYPFVQPVKGTPAPAGAVSALFAALKSPEAKTDLTTAGFRVPGGGAPAGSPVAADVKKVTPLTPADEVSTLKSWDDLAEDARMLVLVDVSGSMSTLVQPGQTRAQLLISTAKLALNALPGTTQIGAWAFSSNLNGKGVDYLKLAPTVAEIGNTVAGNAHKADLIKQLDKMPGLVARNGDTGLYDTIWAAYQAQTASYRPGFINSVVVLTDGKNDDPDGGLNLQQLLTNLGKVYNPKKPVKVVLIAMGADTDPGALRQIATATDGLSYVTKSPSEIATVFIDAFLHRS